jgi:hypothetical protein
VRDPGAARPDKFGAEAGTAAACEFGSAGLASQPQPPNAIGASHKVQHRGIRTPPGSHLAAQFSRNRRSGNPAVPARAQMTVIEISRETSAGLPR